MYAYNKKITFYIYHLILLTALLFCLVSVIYSYVYYMELRGGITVDKHLNLIKLLGATKVLLYYPALTFVVVPATLLILLFFKKRNFLAANLLLLTTTGLILFQFNTYLVRSEYFTEKTYIFSYLGSMIYSAKVSLVLLIQVYVFLVTKKALRY